MRFSAIRPRGGDVVVFLTRRRSIHETGALSIRLGRRDGTSDKRFVDERCLHPEPDSKYTCHLKTRTKRTTAVDIYAIPPANESRLTGRSVADGLWNATSIDGGSTGAHLRPADGHSRCAASRRPASRRPSAHRGRCPAAGCRRTCRPIHGRETCGYRPLRCCETAARRRLGRIGSTRASRVWIGGGPHRLWNDTGSDGVGIDTGANRVRIDIRADGVWACTRGRDSYRWSR